MTRADAQQKGTGEEVGAPELKLAAFVPRGLVGGALMGLANLVPGISGGTMLLAAGVYPAFIKAIADLTTLRFSQRTLTVLGTIVGAAVLAIGLLAGPTRKLVIEERSLMYSLFIGLTLGGLPLVWRLAKPVTPSVWIGAGGGFLLMVIMGLGGGGAKGGEESAFLLFLSGLAGASAMILPGISGGYLLLLLGQYEPILGAIDQVKQGLIGVNGFDSVLLGEAMGVVVPVGIGVVVGVVGVSNALKWLLEQYEKPTLGVLLGLLLGAVVGLYPFQSAVPPEPGFVYRGQVVPVEALAEIEREDWPLERFTPTASDLGKSAAAILLGLGLTTFVARLGREPEQDERGE